MARTKQTARRSVLSHDDEAVPCIWYFDGTNGDARLLTIVDDFLISETKTSSYSIADATRSTPSK